MLKPECSTSPALRSLIATDAFPFEFLSAVATRESWRKEIYRPIYHMHKWWAKRLGSVFRGILLGCLLPESADLQEMFYRKHNFAGVAIFDPFMGSGTTVGEAHKLGCTALGRDINPIACESARVAFGPLDRHQLCSAFAQLAATVGLRIRALYQATDEHGQRCDVLYYFWVKQAPCPHCAASVDLFSTHIVARNAYPDRKPDVQICCPHCSDVFPALYRDQRVQCRTCHAAFDPQAGNARGAQAMCPGCARMFVIAKAIRASGQPPAHRLYGKLVLTSQSEKCYLPATTDDTATYQTCTALLQRELAQGTMHLPEAVLADGVNTRQAMAYNYLAWRHFFNDRQLLALGWLQEAIAGIADDTARGALQLLFSGTLEFNNLFASYKGEGTGAVRHMFSHHILKPERQPIEANVWGTPKSSGSFSTFFETRLLRALDYRSAPFEVRLKGEGRSHNASAPFSGQVHDCWPVDGGFETRGIYLSCGSSDHTDLQDQCLDLVVTDPPFFDNVHYSELADFFYAWQSPYPRGFLSAGNTTRHVREVQDGEADRFADKLHAVFGECHRVLKDEGMMVFTYHHSRAEGWIALSKAIFGAGFSVINAHPVKAELSVATPKSQAKEPIQLDVIFVCCKQHMDSRAVLEPVQALTKAVKQYQQKLSRVLATGLKLSRNDCRIIAMSQFMAALGPVVCAEQAVQSLLSQQMKLEELCEFVPAAITEVAHRLGDSTALTPQQMSLLSSQ